MTTDEERQLDLEIMRKKIKLLEQYSKVLDLLPPRQKKRYVQFLPKSAEFWKSEFCKDCNRCFACKEGPATNLLWLGKFPRCFCDKCFKYLSEGEHKKLYRILEGKGIVPCETYYANAGGLKVVSFEKETDD